jgi:hypothetical protein
MVMIEEETDDFIYWIGLFIETGIKEINKLELRMQDARDY